MNQKISLITFILGLVLVIFSFTLRESYEKEMYQLYINQQKDNLVKGWTKSWQDYLVQNYKVDSDSNVITVKVDRNGKLVDKAFFPTKSKSESDWKQFSSLTKIDQKKFLESQLTKNDSWDKALAVKRLHSNDSSYQFKKLSLYEKTLVDQSIKESVSLIFEQLKNKTDFSNIENRYTFDRVLMKADKDGVVSLSVPSLNYLTKILFPAFRSEANVTEIELSANPFNIQIKQGFNPFKFNSVREKTLMGLGFILLFLAVGLYLLELKNKRLEVLKKVSFLNQLVHEVKTPITGIRLNSELLLKHGHDEELITALMKSSKRLNDFFEDIVLINKGDKSLNLIRLSQSEFQDFLDEIDSEFKNKIVITNSIQESVNIDKGRLRVVLRNLLKNAIRYGKRGTLKMELIDNSLVFQVQDEGPGIDLQDSGKIFEEFYRAKSAKNTSPDGLGIGLSIVKNLVTQMNGEIELKNPGKEHALFELRIKNES
ncbi:HAMP domain-containing sensor histidine kinase [Halobacteriovorax sp. GB3]|uniref:sensor histidine kinase n=1 Tax=Halobacteriovorax sp. GB3 TaxID=2719615 RepID=UPI00235DF2A0|nr:HAMP domain-containing sensor histidine kinase [Halobacteriovorax sp. GB3]MDD0852105.1 HAMP domain-containing sensor histidine kinase [Halobacteriovorax sp. GB3]